MESNFTQLSPTISDNLKSNVHHELLNSHRYLAFAHFSDAKQLLGFKKFFEKHAEEEKNHMKKVVSYLIDKKVYVNVPTVEECDASSYTGVEQLLKLGIGFEKSTSDIWKDTAMLAFKERDFMTFDLAQWFIREQVEEEALFINLLDRWELIKNNPSADYFMDCDVEKNYL